MVALALTLKLLLGECHRTLISRHYLSQCWPDLGRHIGRHMATLGHKDMKELSHSRALPPLVPAQDQVTGHQSGWFAEDADFWGEEVTLDVHAWKSENETHPILFGFGNESMVLCKSVVSSVLIHYCQTFNISCTKFQNLNFSRLVLQLSLPNPLNPGVKSKMKM